MGPGEAALLHIGLTVPGFVAAATGDFYQAYFYKGVAGTALTLVRRAGEEVGEVMDGVPY